MATSPAHRFGQIIGDILEEAMIKYLQPIADKYALYLDHRHERNARNRQREVRWVDVNGNTHKLDIVMEKNGSEEKIGGPRVFIEIAWRRYTKHSKNKAQEISGAIRPLISKYSRFTPFFGAIVAGVFTQNSINQMESEGFEVVFIPIDIIERAFSSVGINAHWEESTLENDLQEKVNAFTNLNQERIEYIKDELIRLTHTQLEKFSSRLCASLEREIDYIRVISIFGNETTFEKIEDACDFIAKVDNESNSLRFYRFEIYVRYSNGDKLEAQYAERQNAIAFLQSLNQ
jgi:hypothetical protein